MKEMVIEMSKEEEEKANVTQIIVAKIMTSLLICLIFHLHNRCSLITNFE